MHILNEEGKGKGRGMGKGAPLLKIKLEPLFLSSLRCGSTGTRWIDGLNEGVNRSRGRRRGRGRGMGRGRE